MAATKSATQALPPPRRIQVRPGDVFGHYNPVVVVAVDDTRLAWAAPETLPGYTADQAVVRRISTGRVTTIKIETLQVEHDRVSERAAALAYKKLASVIAMLAARASRAKPRNKLAPKARLKFTGGEV